MFANSTQVFYCAIGGLLCLAFFWTLFQHVLNPEARGRGILRLLLSWSGLFVMGAYFGLGWLVNENHWKLHELTGIAILLIFSVVSFVGMAFAFTSKSKSGLMILAGVMNVAVGLFFLSSFLVISSFALSQFPKEFATANADPLELKQETRSVFNVDLTPQMRVVHLLLTPGRDGTFWLELAVPNLSAEQFAASQGSGGWLSSVKRLPRDLPKEAAGWFPSLERVSRMKVYCTEIGTNGERFMAGRIYYLDEETGRIYGVSYSM